MMQDDMPPLDYQRIATAITYMQTHFKEQPNLDELAQQVHLSSFHFHRMFTDWAGTTPKKFLQYTSVQYAKQLLQQRNATLFDVAEETGLSSTSRLHDLFMQIEGMTPATYKQEGKDLIIHYRFAETIFGWVLVANTSIGVCHLSFVHLPTDGIAYLEQQFPKATLIESAHPLQDAALSFFQSGNHALPHLKLHLKGTPFQLKVWEALLKIPLGKLESYGNIAKQIQHPKASRAVGTAIGDNPIAFLIPCHRVIQSSGALGGYMWGLTRKTAMIGWEAAKVETLFDEIM